MLTRDNVDGHGPLESAQIEDTGMGPSGAGGRARGNIGGEDRQVFNSMN